MTSDICAACRSHATINQAAQTLTNAGATGSVGLAGGGKGLPSSKTETYASLPFRDGPVPPLSWPSPQQARSRWGASLSRWGGLLALLCTGVLPEDGAMHAPLCQHVPLGQSQAPRRLCHGQAGAPSPAAELHGPCFGRGSVWHRAQSTSWHWCTLSKGTSSQCHRLRA